MDNHKINISMFGSFTFAKDDIVLNDSSNRSKKLWMLLAFLIYNRDKHISQEKLISLLWSEEENNTNPGNALKTLFHRARLFLDELGENTGRNLLICKKGEFYLNPDSDYILDLDIFDHAVKQGRNATDPARKYASYVKAFNVYHGDFLSKFSSESWIIPINTYYHNLYLEAADALIEYNMAQNKTSAVIDICLKVNSIEPYEERFYQPLLRSLIDEGRFEEAINSYRYLADLLNRNFGVKPSKEIKELYREAIANQQDDFLGIDEVQSQLNEPGNIRTGALYCDYDFFSAIYHAMSRSIERNGSVVHLAVITITDIEDKPLSKRSLTVCVNNLQNLICSLLRQGDILSMCSPSQFVLMLPNANHENSERVLERIEKTFYRQFPHTPAKLKHTIQPVLPTTPNRQN